MRLPTLSAAVASLAALALVATGCSGSDDSGAEKVADQLAAQLQHHTLSGVPLASQAAAFDDQVAALKKYAVAVAASHVTTAGDAATADLRWSWRIGAQTWAYKTTARL